MFNSFPYAALEQGRRLEEEQKHSQIAVASLWREAVLRLIRSKNVRRVRGRDVHLVFKDEGHGEPDGLQEQQHTENTEELRRHREGIYRAFHILIYQASLA